LKAFFIQRITGADGKMTCKLSEPEEMLAISNNACAGRGLKI
jgi:hypothetical protein